MVNRHEFRVVGMSRSGNHAIINWMLNQVSGQYCFLNCAEPKYNPYTSARPMGNGHILETNIDGLDLEQERKGNWRQKDVLIYSYEDCFLGMVASPRFERHRDAYVGETEHRRDVLILRDPYNLFASRKKKGGAAITDRTAIRIWKQHAREYLGTRRYLGSDRLVINYNAWAADVVYRSTLAEELALEFSDAGIDAIPSCNGGSSFDGRRFDGRASEMNVYERWRHFADDLDYWRIFDEEIVELSDAVFSGTPGAEALPEADRHGEGALLW